MNVLPLLFQSAFTLSQLPGAVRFSLASKNVKEIQQHILLDYLRKNQETQFGQEHGFCQIATITMYREKVPIRTYQEFLPYIQALQQGAPHILTAENTLYFLPTGGTTGTKLIPYTQTLKQEFQNALAPWLADIAIHFPDILWGKTYWTITPPGTRLQIRKNSKIPIGFEEDSAYFGWKSRLLENIFAVPSWSTQLRSIENFRFLTLYFLLKERNLRWMSLWSPTFLLVLLEELGHHKDRLLSSLYSGTPHLPEDEEWPVTIRPAPLPERTKELEHLFALPAEEAYRKIWPYLSFISLWQDGYAQYPAQHLKKFFTNPYFQGKGLLATEGVVSIPLHAAQAQGSVPAFNAHFFEFVTKDGEAKCLWELEQDQIYSILLTTGGGLYRYAIGDMVAVTGFYKNLPLLRFLGRQGRSSDLAGEKLAEEFVNTVLEKVLASFPLDFSFLLIAPEQYQDTRGYVLFLETSQEGKRILGFARQLEIALRQNVHYDFAVKLRQIAPLQIFLVECDGQKSYLQRSVDEGQKLGDIKPLTFDIRMGWKDIFQGHFLDTPSSPQSD
jgi:hypothetical protein